MNVKTLLALAALTLTLAACQESLEEKAAREAREFTEKNCPSPVAENMVIDSMTYEPATRTLHYYYRLVGFDDVKKLWENESEARRQLLYGLKNATAFKVYKDAGFRFAYTYYLDQNTGEIVYDFTFDKSEYQ